MLGWQGKVNQQVCKRCLHSAAPGPKQPFFHDRAHRIPTLWQTYRSILAQTVQILQAGNGARNLGRRHPVLDSVRDRWRKAKAWTSVQNTQAFIEEERKRLQLWAAANGGDVRALETVQGEIQKIKARQKRIEERRQHNAAKYAEPAARLTGGYLRPTLFNKALPRLTPQPLKLTMMIQSRLRARERRRERRIEWGVWKGDMEREVLFAKRLGLNYAKDWAASMKAHAKAMDQSFERDTRRSETKYDKPLLRRIGKAREQRERSRRENAAKRKADALP